MLDKEDPLHERFIHPRIWETGDPNFATCNADLIGRAAWMLFQHQTARKAEVLEFLGLVFFLMQVKEDILEEKDGAMNIVVKHYKPAYTICRIIA